MPDFFQEEGESSNLSISSRSSSSRSRSRAFPFLTHPSSFRSTPGWRHRDIFQLFPESSPFSLLQSEETARVPWVVLSCKARSVLGLASCHFLPLRRNVCICLHAPWSYHKYWSEACLRYQGVIFPCWPMGSDALDIASTDNAYLRLVIWWRASRHQHIPCYIRWTDNRITVQ